MNRKKIVGISGLAGSGKDTISNYLWERYGYTRIAFADPLRAAAEHLFGVPVSVFLDRDTKEANNKYWDLTYRSMLQLLGNEAIKPVFGDDFWVKRWMLTYSGFDKTDDVVVPDVRFEKEAEFLRSLGGVILHVHRNDAGLKGDEANHASEAGIKVTSDDYFLTNNGTLQDLYRVLDDFIAHLEE
jgi:hypothetical protein